MAALRRLVPLAALGLIVAAFVVGRDVREGLAIEPTPAGLKAWIGTLGWRGVLAFVAVVTFRQFLLVPAAVVLTVGGLAFGVPLGTALGTAGIVASAVMKFSLARTMGRAWLAPRLDPDSALARRLARLGPALVGAATAYPVGPLSPFHWAAGLSSMRFVPFLVVVILASPVRAFAYSLFGSALLDADWTEFVAIAGGLLVATGIPLLHGGFRRWVFGRDA
jgi:uncharacterized membrane protein YdjX (TVP38/TMEM64 family)